MLFGLKSLQDTHWRATVNYLFFTGNFHYYFPCEVIFTSFLARNKPDSCQVLKDFFSALGSGVERTKKRHSQDSLAFPVPLNAKRSRNKTSPLKLKKESSQDECFIFSFSSRKFPLNKPLWAQRIGTVVIVSLSHQKALLTGHCRARASEQCLLTSHRWAPDQALACTFIHPLLPWAQSPGGEPQPKPRGCHPWWPADTARSSIPCACVDMKPQ